MTTRPPAKVPKITALMRAFAREYPVDKIGSKAAVRAGYSPRSAKKIAHELLQRADVRALVDTELAAHYERVKVHADQVVIEIGRMAMFDPADLVNVKSPRDIAALPVEVRRAIVGWSWDRQGRFTIKLAKEAALTLLARHHGLLKDKVEVEITDRSARMKAARERLKQHRGTP